MQPSHLNDRIVGPRDAHNGINAIRPLWSRPTFFPENPTFPRPWVALNEIALQLAHEHMLALRDHGSDPCSQQSSRAVSFADEHTLDVARSTWHVLSRDCRTAPSGASVELIQSSRVIGRRGESPLSGRALLVSVDTFVVVSCGNASLSHASETSVGSWTQPAQMLATHMQQRLESQPRTVVYESFL